MSVLQMKMFSILFFGTSGHTHKIVAAALDLIVGNLLIEYH